jgi:hypothetical protein
VHNDSFSLAKQKNDFKNSSQVALFTGKKIGFMLAYCDNDGSKEREHFISSNDIEAVDGNKNLGYITADVFQVLTLK